MTDKKSVYGEEKERLYDMLVESKIRDWQKPDTDIFARAYMIADYCEKHKISQREFGRRFGLSHSTVGDWCLYNRITVEQYDELRAKGISVLDIYLGLRKRTNNIKDISDLDTFLVELKKKVHDLRKHLNYTPKTSRLIDEAVDALNQMGVDINLKMKR